MKKILLLYSFSFSYFFGASQSQNWWRVNGNVASAGEYIGTNNATDLIFKTNNTTRFTIDALGNIKFNSLIGSGNRILQTDAFGKIVPLAPGNSSQVLYGNGIWGDLPASATAFVSIGSNIIVPNTSKLGIGTNSPTAALDVTGNVNISGVLKSTALASNGGDKIVMIDALGNFKTAPSGGPNTAIAGPCVASALPWYEGGNNIPTNNTIGTCDPSDFILKSNNINTIWNKVDGKIGFGIASPIEKFQFDGGNLLLTNGNGILRKHLLIGNSVTDDVNYLLNVKQFSEFGGILFTGNATLRQAFEVKLFNSLTHSQFLILNNGQTRIGDFDNIFTSATINDPMVLIGVKQNANKGISVVNNANISNLVEAFNVYGNGKTEILATTTSASDDVFTVTNQTTTNKNFTIKNNGQVIIGTKTSVSHPNSELMVNGTILAKEIYVTKPADWPDYVFENNYKLLPLNEVEAFYKKEKHLPNIPSEKELQRTDVSLGELNALLLKKIEELTIYTVELNKEIQLLKTELNKK